MKKLNLFCVATIFVIVLNMIFGSIYVCFGEDELVETPDIDVVDPEQQIEDQIRDEEGYSQNVESGNIKSTTGKQVLEITGKLYGLRSCDKDIAGNLLKIAIHGICSTGCEINDPLSCLSIDSLHIEYYCFSCKKVIADFFRIF